MFSTSTTTQQQYPQPPLELQTPALGNSTALDVPSVPASRSFRTAPVPGSEDAVLEASRLADAQVPDGGYGWVIIAVCGVICFFFVGTTYSWGVFQAALVVEGLSSSSTLAFIGSIAVSFNASMAIINARLLRSIGARNMAFAGVTFMGLGQVLSSFTTSNLGGLFFTAAVLYGIGVGVCFMTCSVLPAQYFSKKRGLANGIVYACGGLGGAVISLSIQGLIDHLGTPWAFRMIGLFILAGGLPAAYFIKERAPIKRRTFIEWRLFRSLPFTFLFLSGVVATFPLFVPPFFLPLYAHSLGLSPTLGAFLVAAFNFASAIGRILTGFSGDKFGPVNSLFFSLLLSALSMLTLWPEATSLAPLIVFVIINGAANGGFFAIMPTVVGNIMGSSRVSVAFGMMVTGWTAGYLLGAPVAGYILEAYGGQERGLKAYRPAIFWAGGMALGASALVAVVKLKINSRFWTKV